MRSRRYLIFEDTANYLLTLVCIELCHLLLIGPARAHEGLRGILRADVVILEAIPALTARALRRILVTALRVLLILMLCRSSIICELKPSNVASPILESMVKHLHSVRASSALSSTIAVLALILLLLLAAVYEGGYVAALDNLVRRQELQALIFKLLPVVLLATVGTHVKLLFEHARPPLLRIRIRLALRVILVDHRIAISRLLLDAATSMSCGRSSLRPLR